MNENLWAPWRLGYVQAGPAQNSAPEPVLDWLPDADRDCFLCRCQADPDPKHTLTVLHAEHCLVVLNRYPYNNGHLLVAPRRHKATLADLSRGEQIESVELLARLTGVLEKVMNCDGFNIGLNLGRVAGAGVPGHLHWHIVPRWHGDTNFMPVLAGTHVIPQSLEALYELLFEALHGTEGDSARPSPMPASRQRGAGAGRPAAVPSGSRV